MIKGCMVVGFTTTCCEFECYSQRGVLDITLYDKIYQWLMAGEWFSSVSSTNKSDCHNINEILLKVTSFHVFSVSLFWRWNDVHCFIYFIFRWHQVESIPNEGHTISVTFWYKVICFILEDRSILTFLNKQYAWYTLHLMKKCWVIYNLLNVFCQDTAWIATSCKLIPDGRWFFFRFWLISVLLNYLKIFFVYVFQHTCKRIFRATQ